MRRLALGLWIGAAVIPAWLAWLSFRRVEEIAQRVVGTWERAQ